MTGTFITFEGGEGSGKSTQLSFLYNVIKSNNLSCVKTREPGGSEGAESIRGLLLNGSVDKWDPIAETLLFYAARLDHVERLIKPALADGTIVLCDRFADSTRVYQGIGKGLSEDYILSLHQLTLGHFKPDLTLILDIDPEVGIKRALSRSGAETRFESMDMDFHHAVRAGFLSIARNEPERCVVIDASQSIEDVKKSVLNAFKQRIGQHIELNLDCF